MDIIKKIKKQISENPILLYMKGSPQNPTCGFSAQAVQAISSCKVKFSYINILEYPDIRKELPKYANWPTFPQLWIKGELFGGCDIILETHENGKLKDILIKAQHNM